MFIDSITLKLSAGKGGNGVVAWRREKFIPKGGPSGGNGGKGGSIIVKTSLHELSLENYRHYTSIKAENGAPGGSNLCSGKNGKDITIEVPCGTLIKDAITKEVLYDLTEEGQSIVLCKGGFGGKGNHHFKSPTNQAPIQWTAGKPGEEKEIEFELKLIADVGLIGMPNAGKSTLMTEITHVPVKIGAYPFTTLHPNLSYVQFDDYSKILIADIPGIIKDAHLNKGLGLAFLKHIERTSTLVFVIDVAATEERDPYEDFCVLREEIGNYNPSMLEKPFLVALNKIDVEGADAQAELFRQKYTHDKSTLYEISAKEKEGINLFLNAVKKLAHRDKVRF